ncbi:unnamed protein product (macronuclear) [Paramecium tetraurelia]|uniref:Uncharacterized protein n=1 Tax=Paramecium tetraurelia TaxID=5888 RepID=A0DTV9_PARTE|nr:uncharacterized protein GSPATT00020159001 [Paramecium tetraurelia]CAK86476.1 unnamed protein product [Paramecium tetraurelia]|eukprot:XP_001453873.1 hypothetical protein (macronuclear) [Paramecium tetraurelia strain d4-2]
MGSCNSCNKYEQALSNQELQEGTNSTHQVKKIEQLRDKTLKNDYEDFPVADESCLENSSQLPIFIKQKEIRDNLVQERMNRFMKDIEEEVKYRIKQQEEQRQIEIEQQNQLRSKPVKNQQKDSSDFNNENHHQTISFQNSQNFQALRNIPGKTYLPKQFSQFAPKKDTETNTLNSQMSLTMNSLKTKTASNKNKFITILQENEKSSQASVGSLNESKEYTVSQEMQCSDNQPELFSSNTSKERSSRSILKNSQRFLSLERNLSLKSTYTNFKQKKVSFSQDTKYFITRGLKRNPTTLFNQ